MELVKRYPAVFWGLGITILFLCLAFLRPTLTHDFINSLELKLYDIRMGMLADPTSKSSIVIVDIDDESIVNIGRWPWPRSYLAQGIHLINAGEPAVIGLNVILSEPQVEEGLEVLKKMEKLFLTLALDQAPNGELYHARMLERMAPLEYDAILAQYMAESGKVVLPATLYFSDVAKNLDATQLSLLESQALTLAGKEEGSRVPSGNVVELPIEQFFRAAAGIGHSILTKDIDGKSRGEQLVYEYRNKLYPSYALTIAARALGIAPSDIKVNLGREMQLGPHSLPLTRDANVRIRFKGPRGAFPVISYVKLLANVQTPEDAQKLFKDKIVLISMSAAGLTPLISTPVEPSLAQGEYSAHVIWSILNNTFITEPQWSDTADLAILLVLGLFIAFVMPRLKAMFAGIAFVLLLAVLLGLPTYLFVSKHTWMPTAYPLMELIIGYIGVVSLRFFVTEAKKDQVEGESAETNRMLGLSFQSQGMLDMAFDKFRKVPVDKGMKEVLYNLALDYERKRQFNKAVSVYEHIEKHDAKFKDIATRKKKMIQVGETVILGGGSGGLSLMDIGEGQRPTLGRYEILKELGKGAMGVVYLGQDPRINRTTAIKTFHFTDDLDPDEVEEMKKRFFQEAESAGTLTHPNIVTIYDAGEEQDLAYIAMEYLEGHDLKRYIKPENILSQRKVIEYCTKLADALDYAHNKGIVHRDIKPANVMLLDTGEIKVTDFGIARITATSQTKTGVVKGTPHYMSPEQISGKKVDGRSDLFSLGVMLYQLLTGDLPFKGDNVATLMHQIMNEPHPDPRTVNPKVVKYLVAIINKALKKDREERYQTAGQMATDLRKVGRWLDGVIAKKKAAAG